VGCIRVKVKSSLRASLPLAASSNACRTNWSKTKNLYECILKTANPVRGALSLGGITQALHQSNCHKFRTLDLSVSYQLAGLRQWLSHLFSLTICNIQTTLPLLRRLKSIRMRSKESPLNLKTCLISWSLRLTSATLCLAPLEKKESKARELT